MGKMFVFFVCFLFMYNVGVEKLYKYIERFSAYLTVNVSFVLQ